MDPFEEETNSSNYEKNRGNDQLTSTKNSTVNISVLGAPGVGKSALVLRFSKSDFMSFYEPTIQEEYLKTISVYGKRINVSVLDTAGQEDFMPMRSQWVKGRDAFILAFEATDPDLMILNEYSNIN